MRYGDAYPGDQSVPDVPALPDPRKTRASEMVREDPRAVDIDILQQENFDPDACKSFHPRLDTIFDTSI
jgi:hypothetical protein